MKIDESLSQSEDGCRKMRPMHVPHGIAMTRRDVAALAGLFVLGAAARAATPLRDNARPLFVSEPTVTNRRRKTPSMSPDGRHGNGVERLLHWPSVVLALVIKYQQNPLRAARALAYVHVGMHDAWVHALVHPGPAAAELAAHRAASLILEQLYPNETPGQFQAQFATSAGHLPLSRDRTARGIGELVAQKLIARSLTDGSGRVWPPKQRPPEFAGIWRPTYPMFAANPAEGLAPSWRTWVEPAPDRYDPPAPPRPIAPATRRKRARSWRSPIRSRRSESKARRSGTSMLVP